MPLHFGRTAKAPALHVDVDAVPAATPSETIVEGLPPRSPPKKISPLRVHIPDSDDDFSSLTPTTPTISPSPSISIRPAEFTLDVPALSPTSSPPSAPSSPHMGRMRGLSVMTNRIKQLVSKEKRRFDGDGFNLDLTYVTDRIIAFGYPAENLEGMYRNHYKDVYNFFERRHGGQYRIYNLCAERTYDKEKFHNRVAEYPFYDHCPPPLSLFVPFCEDVHRWLNENDQNVAAVHCKAGKGRTGVMICAYLLYTRVWHTAYAALEFFGAARSLKREGVTIPSQQRFIRYFAKMCQAATKTDDDGRTDAESVRELAMQPEDFHQLWEETIDGRGVCTRSKNAVPLTLTLPPTVRLVLTRIRIHGVYAHKRIDPRVRIECGVDKVVAAYEPIAMFTSTPTGDSSRPSTPGALARVPVSPTASAPSSIVSTPSSKSRDSAFWSTVQLGVNCDRLLVWDEVKVSFRHRSGTKMGHFWFHTAFVPTDSLELTILKEEIDKLHKDVKKGHKQFAPDFSITLVFEVATPEDMVGLRAARRTHSVPEALVSLPATPSRQRPFASLGDPSTPSTPVSRDSSPGRSRATSDQTTLTPFAAAVAIVAETETTPSRSPSASSIPHGAHSVPSSPRAFTKRFFTFGKHDTSVNTTDDGISESETR